MLSGVRASWGAPSSSSRSKRFAAAAVQLSPGCTTSLLTFTETSRSAALPSRLYRVR